MIVQRCIRWYEEHLDEIAYTLIGIAVFLTLLNIGIIVYKGMY